MAKKVVLVTATTYFKFEYDPNSPEFIQALADYRDTINKGATEEELLIGAATSLRKRKAADAIHEGIGRMKLVDDTEVPSEYSGIEVEDDDPDYEYEYIVDRYL